MIRRLVPTSLLSMVLLVGGTFASAQDEVTSAEADKIVTLEINPEQGRKFPLEQDCVFILEEDGQHQEIPVVLEQMFCSIRAQFVRAGKPRKQSGRRLLYELRSTDADIPYTWAHWPSRHLVGFRLFSNKAGQNYLAWVLGYSVIFAEVSKPKDERTALAERLLHKRPAQMWHVPVGDLVPPQTTWGLSALYSEIDILSVAKDEAGNFVVEVASPQGDHFTIVGDGENWHLE